jgi:hypothetical protein
MRLMADRPKKSGGKRNQGRARETGKTRLVTVELDVKLDDALEAFRQKDRRTKKAVIEMALEEYLAARKAWPQPDTSDS